MRLSTICKSILSAACALLKLFADRGCATWSSTRRGIPARIISSSSLVCQIGR